MAVFKVRQIVYKDQEIDLSELMTVKDAAARLDLTLYAVLAMVHRGRLTEVLDPNSLHAFKNRRLVLRSEVEAEAEARKGKVKWGDADASTEGV